MKFEDFKDFFEKAQQLFLDFPTKTRYAVVYRPGDQRVRIKVTNDIVTYNFETEDQTTIKKIDVLNDIMMKLMVTPSLDFNSVKEVIQKEIILPQQKQ